MAVNTIGTMTLDELVASGRSPLHTKVIELAKGTGELKRGQLIGVTEAEGVTVYAAMASGATPYAILCKDVTLGSSAVKVEVYVSGHFNGNKVIGYTDAHYNALRDKGIFVDKALEY